MLSPAVTFFKFNLTGNLNKINNIMEFTGLWKKLATASKRCID